MNLEGLTVDKLEGAINCMDKGHPHPHRVLIPLREPGGKVYVECTNCLMSYDRNPTNEDIKQYNESAQRYDKLRKTPMSI